MWNRSGICGWGAGGEIEFGITQCEEGTTLATRVTPLVVFQTKSAKARARVCVETRAVRDSAFFFFFLAWGLSPSRTGPIDACLGGVACRSIS
jgi:hypothetical protein